MSDMNLPSVNIPNTLMDMMDDINFGALKILLVVARWQSESDYTEPWVTNMQNIKVSTGLEGEEGDIALFDAIAGSTPLLRMIPAEGGLAFFLNPEVFTELPVITIESDDDGSLFYSEGNK